MKNIYIIGGLAVSGVLAYFLFFRKNESLKQQLAQLPSLGGNMSSPTGRPDSVLDSSNVKQEETTKEEFEFYKGKYNDLLEKIREVGEKIDQYERRVEQYADSYGMKMIYASKVIQEQKKIDDFNVELKNIEQNILDLGYLMTERGTFYKR